MADNPYSRYPVYENDVDNIVGILHIKDVFKSLLACPEGKKVQDVMRKPYYVPGNPEYQSSLSGNEK